MIADINFYLKKIVKLILIREIVKENVALVALMKINNGFSLKEYLKCLLKGIVFNGDNYSRMHLYSKEIAVVISIDISLKWTLILFNAHESYNSFLYKLFLPTNKDAI